MYHLMIGCMLLGLVISGAVKAYVSHKHLNSGMTGKASPTFRAWKGSKATLSTNQLRAIYK